MTKFFLWICKIHRRRLQRCLDTPFDATVSQELDALDALIENMEKRTCTTDL